MTSESFPYLILLSKATVNTIRFSIALSMSANFIVVLPVLGILTPVTGTIVHNAGSCFVALIAALLYERKIRKKAEKALAFRLLITEERNPFVLIKLPFSPGPASRPAGFFMRRRPVPGKNAGRYAKRHRPALP